MVLFSVSSGRRHVHGTILYYSAHGKDALYDRAGCRSQPQRKPPKPPAMPSELDIVLTKWKTLFTKKLGRSTAKFVKNITSLPKLKLIGILLLLAFILHELRNLFYRFAPYFLRHFKVLQGTANEILFDYWAMITVIKAVVHVIEESIHLLTAGKFPHNVPKLKHLGQVPQLNSSEFRHILKVAVVSCDEIDTGWETLHAFVRGRTSPHVCPLLRAATPMGKFGKAVNTIGDPLSFDPSPQGNNCDPGDFDKSVTTMCLFINSGVVVMQVVLPIIIAIVFLQGYIMIVGEAAWLTIETAQIVIKAAVNFIARRFLG